MTAGAMPNRCRTERSGSLRRRGSCCRARWRRRSTASEGARGGLEKRYDHLALGEVSLRATIEMNSRPRICAIRARPRSVRDDRPAASLSSGRRAPAPGRPFLRGRSRRARWQGAEAATADGAARPCGRLARRAALRRRRRHLEFVGARRAQLCLVGLPAIICFTPSRARCRAGGREWI